MKYIMALDQGTTSSRAVLFDHDGRPVHSAAFEFTQHFPQPGWVEHDPLEIWETQKRAAQTVLAGAKVNPEQVAALGITNQRETTVLWEKDTGRPVFRAIVWQCRRTAPLCRQLQDEGLGPLVREKTGLVIDAYFSATKIAWLLRNIPGLAQRAAQGEILFGTVDAWLIYCLTGGRVHATDVSNASRTMLFNIHKRAWDDNLLRELDVPRAMLPQVFPSVHPFGRTSPEIFDGVEIPITGVAGDQQAALFGQTCFEPGQAKATYGTGAFLLMNTGPRAMTSTSGLITSLAWGLGDEVTYCLEGSIFIAGAAIQWLRDQLRIIDDSGQTAALAESLADNEGVYFVPALAGLGAPYWDMDARGTIVGLTRGSGREHLVRAALEAIAYQTRDVIDCMAADAGLRLTELMIDGGAAANDFLAQFQADILNATVLRPEVLETTALGAAFLAGLGVGFWTGLDEIKTNWRLSRTFDPKMDEPRRQALYADWRRAVERARAWAS
jgi:glycerol kinase